MPAITTQIRRLAKKFGFDIVRHPNPAELQLAELAMLKNVRSADADELEEMYRRFVFPDLPRRARKDLLSGLIGTSIGEAIYVIQHLHLAMNGPGDICEFGVAQGATSRLIAGEIFNLQERNLWLFDSFEGLPAPAKQDRLINDIFNLGSINAYKGTMACAEEQVLDKLRGIRFPGRRTKIKKGWVRDTIKEGDLPIQVAFAYVDLDFYEPIKDALYFVNGRMPTGGRIVVDDYGWFSEGAQVAVDEFLAETKDTFTFELPLKSAGYFCVLTKRGN